MKLVKLAVTHFEQISEKWADNPWSITDDGITVNGHLVNEKLPLAVGKRILLTAFVDLSSFPEIDLNNDVIIPEIEVRRTELAIENAANLISISEKSQRSLKSLIPSFALVYENQEDKNWLDKRNDIKLEWNCFWTNQMKPDFDNSILAKLFDRTDGIKLITEAHTHKNAVGKYREYVRLFERAFQRPFTMLAKKLNQFLGDSKLDYSLDEINKWISFRHQVTHADSKGKYKVIIESDIQKYIPRIEQAAYDVLLI